MKLKEIRASMGWTQSDLAQQLGVSIKTIQNWEQGRYKMNRTAEKLLRLLIKF